MTNSHTGSSLKQEEIDISQNIIDNIFSSDPAKKLDPVSSAVPQMTEGEKSEMSSISESAAEIAGLPQLAIKNKQTEGVQITESGSSLSDQVLSLIEQNSAKIPGKLIDKVILATERIEKCEDFLLRFLKKFG